MPDKKFRILLVYPNLPMILVVPLSIAVFTWILKKEGFEVEYFDTTQYGDGDLSSPQKRIKYLQARKIMSDKNLELLMPTDLLDDFREKIAQFGPDLILYSFVEDGFPRALNMLRISNRFGIPTILGGILATSDPEWLLSFPEINMVAVGEGEEVVREVALKLAGSESISNVENLWIKNKDGSVIHNPTRPYVNLDDYSTDFTLFDEDRFIRPMGGKLHKALPIETYRGCPNRCTFCNSPSHNKKAKQENRVYLRRKSTEKIRDEIAHIKDDHDVNLLYFIDDSFLQRPKRELNEFIEMYEEFKIPFWINTRPESCSKEILTRLKDVGLFRVSFGIESGNEDLRMKRLKRKVTNDELIHYFKIISDSGVTYSINCIIGFPFETREMVFDTIRLVKQIKGYDSITVSTFVPYRGTELRKAAVKEGWLDPDIFVVNPTESSILQMSNFSNNEINGLMHTFPLYVEFDESVWSELEMAERSLPGGEAILEKYTEIYREKRWGEKST